MPTAFGNQQTPLGIAETIITSAEIGRRELTRSESSTVAYSLAESKTFGRPSATAGKRFMSGGYVQDFAAYMKSGGSKMGATTYEGQDALGGIAVPSVVDGNVVQLSPEDGAIRQLATIFNTEKILKLPVQTSTGLAAVKPQTTAAANFFTQSSPALTGVQLSAYSVGVASVVSMELFDDAPAFMAFLEQDLGADVETAENLLFLTGTGIGMPQGILGRVNPFTAPTDTSGDYVTVAGCSAIMGSLKSNYLRNAGWLFNRATGVSIRAALLQAGNPYAWARDGGQEYFHGYPVSYSAEMPDAAPGTSPVLFGDFAAAYAVAQRSNGALRMLTIPEAIDPDTNLAYILSGRLYCLLFRRVDGRVTRAEALSEYKIAAS